MVDQNIILLGYILPLAFGAYLLTPASSSVASSMPTLHSKRRRLMAGLNLTLLIGFIVSVHTLWISNKISEGAAVCSTATVFSCDDVLGNTQYNTDPVFGISWGLLGMLAFGLLLFFANSVSKEPDALWARRYMQFGMVLTAGGMGVIALLVSYEVRMEKICQFCTTAHAANIIGLFGFWRAGKMMDAGEWNDKEAKEASKSGGGRS